MPSSINQACTFGSTHDGLYSGCKGLIVSLNIQPFDQSLRARVWLPADALAACLPKIRLPKTSGQFSIPEGPLPELEAFLTVQILSFLDLLVNWSQNRCERAGTRVFRHSLAYRELWSLYPSRQDFLKALESDVVRFLACHLSSTASPWQTSSG